ncbi:hypothetical protein DQ384_21070 [Sphaerisporangium album]|uniref:Uncharacterized protein n=1 Tax=Sphaerisporangium album TaxID=509200 RepID=A0A367FHY7_9ACTN|nr:hypothetical protein [Sphaerisporangium album]RCG29519.1 hypothetical protein DQ384_21070 [Sphaerisporangium album]
MKLISTTAQPWVASLCADDVVVPATRGRRFAAPLAPEVLGLAAAPAAKLRQEKTAHIPAEQGMGAFAYRISDTVSDLPAAFGRRAGDPQTPSTANGGVQGPPPWRQPVSY